MPKRYRGAISYKYIDNSPLVRVMKRRPFHRRSDGSGALYIRLSVVDLPCMTSRWSFSLANFKSPIPPRYLPRCDHKHRTPASSKRALFSCVLFLSILWICLSCPLGSPCRPRNLPPPTRARSKSRTREPYTCKSLHQPKPILQVFGLPKEPQYHGSSR